MAAPRLVRGLRASTRLSRAAPLFLAARRADFERHQSAVSRRLTPNAVHDLRVALRRLRGAVRLHGKDKRVRRALTELARLQAALGGLRDLHVQLARLARLQKRLPPEEAAVVAHLRTTCGLARTEAVGGSRAALQRWAKRGPPLLAALNGLQPRGKLGGHRLRQRLVHQVEQLEELVGDALVDPTPDAMHRLRISVKRFRYALEFLEPAMPAETSQIRNELVPLQTGLGDLHDLDVEMLLVDRHASPATLPIAAQLLRRLRADREREAAAILAALLHWEEEATALRAQLLLASSPVRIQQRMP
jgi:CHAD domain-containing protein